MPGKQKAIRLVRRIWVQALVCESVSRTKTVYHAAHVESPEPVARRAFLDRLKLDIDFVFLLRFGILTQSQYEFSRDGMGNSPS
jgi:hypothetical protein